MRAVALALPLAAVFGAPGAASGGDGGLAGGGPPFEELTLQRDDAGEWRFAARLLTRNASFNVRLRLPGGVVDTNADELRTDGELLWRLDPWASHARSSRACAPGPARTRW